MVSGHSKTLRRPAWAVLPALAVVLGLIFLEVGVASYVYVERRDAPGSSAVYFSPGGSPTEAVVAELNAATETVHVQAYSFTSAPIAQALVAAEKRGVAVTAILDRSNQTAHYSAADFLAHEGVPTLIDARHAIAHNKVIIIDGRTVLSGSFNFTKAAQEKNAENLLVLHDATLAQQYEENWQRHRAHSVPYAGR